MKLDIKRSQWECYTDTPDSVIETINAYFGYVLTTKENAFDAQEEMYKFLNMFKEWGFRDSECDQCTTETINKFYKSNLSRWDATCGTAYS